MTDLYVHVRLKECCRKTLGEIDAIKKGIGGTGAFRVALLKLLGDKTVPEAMTALATTIGKSAPEGDRRFTALKKKTLTKAASAHAEVHRAKAETTEAALWDSLAAVLDGKDAPKPAPGLGGAAELGSVTASGTLAGKAKLEKAAADALKAHPGACNTSTAAVAEAMGHPELAGKLANAQVDYMDTHWKPLSPSEAQALANNGALVVAGKKKDGGHGHTAIVMPGDGATKPDGSFYPNVLGGALGGPTSAGYSDGTKTAGDVWNRNERGDVRYYAPR